MREPLIALFAVSSLAFGCAVPGAPVRHFSAVSCPSVRVAGVDLGQVTLDLTVPEPIPYALIFWKSTGDEPLTPLEEIALNDEARLKLNTGASLSLSDPSFQSGIVQSYAISSPQHSACTLAPHSVLAQVVGTPTAPEVVAGNTGVRVRPPSNVGPLARLYRRNVKEKGAEATLLLDRWDTSNDFVDFSAEVRNIYAYSVAELVAVEVDGHPDPVIAIQGATGPESYAAVPDPAQLFQD